MALYGIRSPNPTPGCWESLLVLAAMHLAKIRDSITKEGATDTKGTDTGREAAITATFFVLETGCLFLLLSDLH